MSPVTDPLAVTVDAQGRRWIRCARCAGSGKVRRLKGDSSHKYVLNPVHRGEGKFAPMDFEELPCPACNGIDQVEVP